jgi:hypothetical protein
VKVVHRAMGHLDVEVECVVARKENILNDLATIHTQADQISPLCHSNILTSRASLSGIEPDMNPLKIGRSWFDSLEPLKVRHSDNANGLPCLPSMDHEEVLSRFSMKFSLEKK